MATAGDGRTPYENGGAGDRFRERPFQPENSTGMSSDESGNSAASGISLEPEQISEQEIVIRSKIQHPTTMENLPDEILLNIFIHILAKQLAQMRSVSKSWNVLLSQPSFVKSHLHHSIHNNKEQILLVFLGYNIPFTQYSSQSSHLETTNFIQHTPAHLSMSVIGSINGLICLSGLSFSNIHIWNPSLSAVSAIPLPHSNPHGPNYATSIRFGFDPKTEDYKLVKLTGFRGTPNALASVKEWLQVQIYSMRKGSWEFITQPFPSHIARIYSTDYVCVDGHDGHLHWQYMTGLWTKRTIVAYDLGLETFREIPLPDSILKSNHGAHHSGVLGGKLCEISWHDDGEWEVWVMEEYGVSGSWVRRHGFPQFTIAAWKFPFGFTSRNELLLVDKDNRLVLYDPVANKTKSTRTEEFAIKIVDYVDSLVWI